MGYQRFRIWGCNISNLQLINNYIFILIGFLANLKTLGIQKDNL